MLAYIHNTKLVYKHNYTVVGSVYGVIEWTREL